MNPLARILLRIALRVPIVIFVASLLVCLAPGFDSDERLLDLRLSSESVEALRAARTANHSPLAIYGRYLAGLTRGDFGHSQIFNRPVSELLRERLPATLRTVGAGVLAGWLVAAALGSGLTILRSSALQDAGSIFSGALLCVPSALLAFGCVVWNAPIAVALACLVFARLFLTINAFFRKTLTDPHIIAAEAVGMPRPTLFLWHIALPNAPQMIALAASSISMALSAVVPLEAISDSPGIGQLAWRATLGRDVPVLLAVTLVIAAVNTAAAAAADIVIDSRGGPA